MKYLETINTDNIFSLEIRQSLYVIVGISVLIIIFSLLSSRSLRHVDPLKKPKGLAFIAEAYVDYVDRFVVNYIGKEFKMLSSYFGFLILFVPAIFLSGLLGFVTVASIYSTTITLALGSFILIQAVSIHYNGFLGWLKKKFLEPIFIFLPINILTFWTPVISLSFRLFGNALASDTILSLVYWATGQAISFSPVNFVGAIVAAPLHLYFDLFGAFVQTMVFVMISALLMGLEKPETEEEMAETVNKGGNI